VDGFTALEGIDAPLKIDLSATIGGVVEGRRAAWVTANIGRIMVWWLDLATDLRAGDRLKLLYEPLTGDEVRIAALRYESQKKAKEFRAYYFVPSGAKYGSYWDETGREVPPRLKETPIEDYQQITAVLGDGRDHRGWDFRAPTGTPVFAPRAATGVRTTWNFKYNGNSLELRYGDGAIARYLHLEGVADGVTSGSSVRAGQQVGTSGNTGRSNAPHLHYEVELVGGIVDPAEYHGTIHRTLSGSDLDTFYGHVARLDEAITQIPGVKETETSAGDDVTIVEEAEITAEDWALLGDMALSSGNCSSAISSFRRAVAVRPTNAAYNYKLGLAYHRCGQGDQAMKYLEQAAATHSEASILLREIRGGS